MNAVVFDLDDTLYPERDFVLSGFRAVSAWLEKYQGLCGMEQELVSLFAAGERKFLFNAAFRRMGQPDDESLIRTLVQVYRTHRPEIKIFDDATRVLPLLVGSYKLGLITDGFAGTQRNKVAALGISSLLDALVFSDDFGRENWKPSPVPFLEIGRILAVKPSLCLYVGDNPLKDFVAARKLGWYTVRVRREGTEHYGREASDEYEADTCIGNLEALPDVLSGIARVG